MIKVSIYHNDKEVSCHCGSDIFLILDAMWRFSCVSCGRGYTKAYIEASATLRLQPQPKSQLDHEATR